MAGWIDLHCHILPSVDDGAVDLEMSLEMARQLKEAGFEVIAPSPHYGFGPGGHVTPSMADDAREVLRHGLDDAQIGLTLLPNAEHHVSPEMFGFFQNGEVVPVGGKSKWVLVELPWNPIPKPEDILFRLSVKGYKLILAHPERYKYVDRRMVERLVSRGVLMQIELGSYVGVYGSRAEERAWRYLERGWSHCVATDLHRPHLDEFLPEAMRALKGKVGDAGVERGLRENPQLLIDDASADAIRPLGI